ncbi:MAG: UDP-N-acetylmuramate dehydrogenase [Firmicutes bacterium]|nr:UDP-N-acetylmuramate dehydrogenase [Bacillota bacterium]
MADQTSFKCGGRAAIFAVPSSEEALAAMIEILENEGFPYMFMGNGSNLLFTDSGYEGAVIKASEGLSSISAEGCEISAGAGVSLIRLARQAAALSLTGLEFASGIPGSLGGAVFMNAGAYGGEMKQVLVSVRSMDRQGRIIERSADELDLSYRHSVFSENGEFILSAVIRLSEGDKDAIEARMRELAAQRSAKQPLNLPSAGSFFKRPEGYFAGKLIEDCGLKGLQLGGAQISPLHAGFMVNAGGAAATDVIDLMKVVQETVMDRFGVLLEPEVRIIGRY